MQLKLTKQTHNQIILLCCVVYFTSYVTRINYGAALEEIIQSMNISSTVAGLAVTGSFITYGVGQLVSGYLGDKINPRFLITIGLIITSVCNVLVALLANIYVIAFVWCLNGFAQAFLWPPLVKTMVDNLSLEKYRQGCAYVTGASAVATIVVYLVVPICITFSSWRFVFILSAIAGLVTAGIWLVSTKPLTFNLTQSIKNEISDVSVSTWSLIQFAGLIPIGIVIVMQGILRDGITTWMPSYINTTFELGSSISILTGAILPLFTILSIVIANKLRQKAKTEVVAALQAWVGAMLAIIILLSFRSSFIVSVLMMSFITGCMHAVNLMLIGNLPIRFQKYSRVSFFSGLLNFCTYIGSALSVYAIAKISDLFGWNVTIFIWLIIAVVGASLCGYCIKKNKTFYEETA